MLRGKKAIAKETLIPKKVENRGYLPTDIEGVPTFFLQEGGDFRILQLTDVHLGNTFVTRAQDKLAKNAIIRLVEFVKPDLIVFTGDNVYPMPHITFTSNNYKQTKAFCDFVEKFEIPWACVFGNHDTEVLSKASKQDLSDLFESQPHCLYKRGKEGLFGVGNYRIDIKNPDGTLNNALYLLDSNMYGKGNFFTGFDVIHDEQIAWYKRDLTNLKNKYGYMPKSLAFFHMPLGEYKDAWNLLRYGSPEVTYKMGSINEPDNYLGISRIRGKFFDAMVEMGSTKGTFCGHDHYNTLSMVYKGIQLTYGMSIDYLAYHTARRWHSQRGGTVITIQPDTTFSVAHQSLSMLEIGTLGNDVVR